MNKNIWSGDENFSVRSDVGRANKLDTSVQQYSTNERNTASPQIEEESLKSVFSKTVEESNSSERMNLANSAIIEPPKLGSFGHPLMETENILGIVTTRIENSDGIWRCTASDDRMAYMHDDVKTISEKIAYRKHIRYSEFETTEFLERETLNKILKILGLD